MRQMFATVGVMTALFVSATGPVAAGDLLPGDNGRGPHGGIFPVAPANAEPAAAPVVPDPRAVRGPSIELAQIAVKAIAKACKKYPLGIAVVNSEGAPILVYVPDGSRASHGFVATRKAYSAVVLQARTSEFTARAQQGDADLLAKLKADPNLMTYPGGIPLQTRDRIVGAIGVSGAEPGHHDEECGLVGLEKIKNKLK